MATFKNIYGREEVVMELQLANSQDMYSNSMFAKYGFDFLTDNVKTTSHVCFSYLRQLLIYNNFRYDRYFT